jgi:hypothetical protein
MAVREKRLRTASRFVHALSVQEPVGREPPSIGLFDHPLNGSRFRGQASDPDNYSLTLGQSGVIRREKAVERCEARRRISLD